MRKRLIAWGVLSLLAVLSVSWVYEVDLSGDKLKIKY